MCVRAGICPAHVDAQAGPKGGSDTNRNESIDEDRQPDLGSTQLACSTPQRTNVTFRPTARVTSRRKTSSLVIVCSRSACVRHDMPSDAARIVKHAHKPPGRAEGGEGERGGDGERKKGIDRLRWAWRAVASSDGFAGRKAGRQAGRPAVRRAST